jgi:hypothetical protein
VSRPIGSKCCDWTVQITERYDKNDNFVFICDNCGDDCEVIE